MKNEVVKFIYDGVKSNKSGTYPSLSSAHADHKEYDQQQTFEDIEKMDSHTQYMHLMEFRDGEHYNDLYFTLNPN